MAKKNDDKDLIELLNPLLDKWVTTQTKIIEANAPIVKRWQWINFIIMLILSGGVLFLAYSRVIDGSAATGLIGAMIGYVFGRIYSDKSGK